MCGSPSVCSQLWRGFLFCPVVDNDDSGVSVRAMLSIKATMMITAKKCK